MGEINAAEAVKFGADIKGRFVALSFAMAGRGRWERMGWWLGVEGGEVLLYLFIALVNEVLIVLPSAEGLLEHEEVFWPPIPLKAASDGVAGSFDPMVLQGREFLGIAFAGEDGLENEQAGDAGEIADDIVNLNIHLSECLVQVSHVIGGVTNEIVTVTKQGAHRANLLGRTEAGSEKTDGVKILEPLTIADVRFAAGDILGVTCVDKADFQTSGFEDLKERDPVNSGGFHGDGFNSAGE